MVKLVLKPRRALVAVVVGAATALLAPAAYASTDFASVTSPFTSATDFATDFPSYGFGPSGLIADGTNFYALDVSNGMLYKLPASGGSASTAQSAATNFSYGMALSHGTYFAATWSGLGSFDPTTLAAGPVHVAVPCGGIGVVGDPLSADVYVSSVCGIYRVQNPASSSPTVTPFVTGTFYDGIEFTQDGQHLWGAGNANNTVAEYSRSGALEQTVPEYHGPDGIAVAYPNTVIDGFDYSNNVFVNNNDGTVVRIDTNNADAVSTVASGGNRGDLSTVGPDGCFYITQVDRVEKIAPCIFEPTQSPAPPPPTTTSPYLSVGAFVISNQNAVVGDNVTFWGAQAWKQNGLDGATMPAAFKGFATNVVTNPIACGSQWSTTAGNSSAPPATVPSVMAVIVSSSATKHGSTISGTTDKVVLIRTDPGYGPNPGHAGTGTVIGTLCG